MPVAVGLRERKKIETRRAISRAALELAVELGPDRVTVDDIAAAADVSPRTVFNYFATKEEAILGVDPDRATEVAAMVTAQPPGVAPLAALRTAFVEIATSVPELAGVARLRAALVRDHPQLYAPHVAAFSAFEDALVAAVAARVRVNPARSIYPRLVVSTAIAAFRLAIDRAGPGARSLVGAINAAFAALENGLAPPAPGGRAS